MTTIDFDARLDGEHIRGAALWAAEALDATGVAKVRLAPGDMTEYALLIAAPGIEWAYGQHAAGSHYWVAVCANFGCGYEWGGFPVHADYCADKWVARGASKGTRMWAGQVIARFLTALAEALGEGAS